MSHFANHVLTGLPPKNPGESMIIKLLKWCGWQVAFAFMLVIIVIGCIVVHCLNTLLGEKLELEIVQDSTAKGVISHE